jgi:CBS domain containing-hemolysin-like protein
MTLVAILVLTVLLFLLLEGFLSGSEMAMVAADRKRLARFAHSGPRSARLTFRILQNPSWFLSTALVGSNLAEVANAALVTALLVGHFGPQGDLWAFLLLTPLILVFGEILPKTLFRQLADRWVLKIVPIIYVVSYILYPVVWFMSKATEGVLRILGLEGEVRPFVTREELQLLLQSESGPTDMKPHEKTMIRRIFRFADTKVREVMIPLVNVTALEDSTTVAEAVASVRQENYSRYPVFQERIDNIIGLVHSFDLLLAPERGQTIQPFIRPISFFPESKPIDELLLELQRKQEALAVVVDEYGGAVGIVTVEDILEEVVGEIEDEYDSARPLFRRIGPKAFLINARMEIDHINEILKLGLPRGDYETLGGFVLNRLGRVPLTGESFRYRKMLFDVKKANERAVTEVLISLRD